ncbi:hypothetical protein L211DRAFT_893983 [Terfezia boudieri ATCC MYA-4762]|uniref:Retrotransposon Copia-like N-terminal domain-containing protein n=1 Tax=Terfezia boudieri ATCC MYA-4762 TaxID=1051890 RepID=A0A3N4MDC7_9PEZI|nr:hypothetical protein L211DRAFT_893983 [Terfezia boudieri ATCC MYA-4762]
MSAEAGPSRQPRIRSRAKQNPIDSDEESDTIVVSTTSTSSPSTSASCCSYASGTSFTPSRARIEILDQRDQKNYDLWSQQLLMIFDALDATQVVVNGYKPPITASPAEQAHHKHIETESLLLIQVVSQQIMQQIGRHRSAHKIWQYLRKTYYKDSPLSFVHEIHAFNSLSSTLDTSQSITDCIDRNVRIEELVTAERRRRSNKQ